MIAALSTGLSSLVFVVIYLVGLVLAFTWRAHHPRVSLWAALGFGSLLLATVLTTGLQIYLMQMAADGTGMGRIGMYFGVIGVLGTVIRVFGSIALMVAVFGWRGR